MDSKKRSTIDPITLELMRNRIQSIADEMTAALERAAYSTNIKDRMDCSCAVLTLDGEVVAQTELGTPFHLGVMPSAVKIMLEHFPPGKLEKGDVIISNIPFPIGPGHLSDVAILSPVYYGKEIVAIVANQAHHVDMGGFAPGSMPFGVTEIYQEGLQIPPVRLCRNGELDQGISSLIMQNIRTVKVTKGDIMAQIAANNVGIDRLNEMLDKYGKNAVLHCLDDILDYGERNMRVGISKLPQGKYSFEDYIEGDGIDEKLIKIRATIEIKKDHFVVDFAGTDRQVKGPMNARISSAQACVYFALKAIINPDLPTNSGSYRAIEVKVEEGSLVQAKFPAAVCNANILTGQRVVDVILGAMLKAVPDKIPAACSGEMNLVNIGGLSPDDGHYYNYVSTYGGGQGALHCQDGMDGVQTHMTNTRNAPVEVIEASYPLRVEKYGLVADSEGAGKYRGGLGMTYQITILGDEPTFTMGADRRKIGPWGVDGGKSGGTSNCYVIGKDGKKKILPSKVTTTLHKGDKVVIITPGGGGWGHPKERDSKSIAKDVKDKLISIKRAKEVYGWNPEQTDKRLNMG
ncbi:MAG: hydantoinase B/oxoprolinase family protein [Phycisphaerae bacterium]|nr:hydantoinase B/oxoprolinase family protein [Phycisphaerae bacterium]